MKKVNLVLFTLLGSVTMLLSSCGGGFSNLDPQTYHNELMTLMNNSSVNITEMNSAMNSEDYKKAEEIRKTWLEDLDKAIAQADKIGSFKGDDTFQKAIVKTLNGYKKIVSEDYDKLIKMRAANDEDEDIVLDQISDALVKVAEEANNASDTFMSSFE